MVKQNSDTFSIGCICYVANLCAQDGIKLSVPVDDLIDIYCNSEHNEIHLRAPAFHRWLIWTYCNTLDLLVIKKKLWTINMQLFHPILRATVMLKSLVVTHEVLKSPKTQMTTHFHHCSFWMSIISSFKQTNPKLMVWRKKCETDCNEYTPDIQRIKY